MSAEPGCKCGKTDPTNDIKHPWFAELYYKKGSNFIYTCNGVLISPWIVLTASYCASQGKYVQQVIDSCEFQWCGFHFFSGSRPLALKLPS